MVRLHVEDSRVLRERAYLMPLILKLRPLFWWCVVSVPTGNPQTACNDFWRWAGLSEFLPSQTYDIWKSRVVSPFIKTRAYSRQQHEYDVSIEPPIIGADPSFTLVPQMNPKIVKTGRGLLLADSHWPARLPRYHYLHSTTRLHCPLSVAPWLVGFELKQ